MTGKEKFVILLVIGVVITMTLQSFLPAMRYLDRSAIILVAGLLFFFIQSYYRQRTGRNPLEHRFAFQRGHEYRFLSLAGGHGPMAGRSLAEHVQGISLAGLCHEHRHLCLDHDQLHHERGGHRHFLAGGLGHCQIPGGQSRRWSFLPPWSPPVCPLSCLIGAAPNAMSYESKQFTTGEFFGAGIPASIVLLLVLTLAILTIWPIFGMPILVK